MKPFFVYREANKSLAQFKRTRKAGFFETMFFIFGF
jgi:hypothetical protein